MFPFPHRRRYLPLHRHRPRRRTWTPAVADVVTAAAVVLVSALADGFLRRPQIPRVLDLQPIIVVNIHNYLLHGYKPTLI